MDCHESQSDSRNDGIGVDCHDSAFAESRNDDKMAIPHNSIVFCNATFPLPSLRTFAECEAIHISNIYNNAESFTKSTRITNIFKKRKIS